MARTEYGQHRGHGRRRRAFTLAESLMASAVLMIVVLALASALASAQKVAFEGRKHLMAAMAADDLMSELMTLSYDDLVAQDGREEAIGSIASLDGSPYPGTYWALGRRVSMKVLNKVDKGTGTSVPGVEVSVEAFDEFITIVQYTNFVAEPVS